MYVFVKAIAMSKDLGAQWEEVDISQIQMSTIFLLFKKVYVTLSNVYLENNVVVDLDTIKKDFCYSELTFNGMLLHIGNRSLVTTNFFPDFQKKFVTFSDAFRIGYKVEPMNIYASIDASLPHRDKTSLRLSRPIPQTDMQLFYDHCLVSINGFLHRTDCDGSFAYVLNANESLFKSRQNQIGILNFIDIGKVEQIPIIESMISKQSNNVDMKHKTFLKIDKDITDKTVLLVLGGYLLFVDNRSFMQINDDTFALNFNEMPLLERYFESNPYINLSSLNLPISSDNTSVINVPEFFSDETLTKYLMLPQSFFVVIDTKSLKTEKKYIQSSNFPGMFTTRTEPIYPLFVGNGRIAEYWKTLEDDVWSVTVQDSYLKNNVFSYTPHDTLVNISDSRVPITPTYNSRGFLLAIESVFA